MKNFNIFLDAEKVYIHRYRYKPASVSRDFRPLSNDGHWQEAIPVGSSPLCAATDPAADFRWHALQCGGPEVASFICELPGIDKFLFNGSVY